MVFLVIALLSFLVLLHEFGHYLAAKRVGIHVEEFGIGYPPTIVRLFTYKGTAFTLNLLPLGGFVRLAGDDAETIEGGTVANTKENKLGLFSEQSSWKRLQVVYAGALANLLFGIAGFAVIYSWVGIPTQLLHPRIKQVIEHSPAEQAGLKNGDQVLALNKSSVATVSQFIEELQKREGEHVKITIQRETETMTIESYIRTKEETPENQGALGVALAGTELKKYAWWQMPFRGIVQGIQDSLFFSLLILKTFGQMIQNLIFSGKVPSELSGPIGVVYSASKEQLLQKGFFAVLNFASLISINLGVVNVLPIPALDGGRALFIFFERLIGKKKRAEIEHVANVVGMAMLLLLLAVISIKDISNIVQLNFVVFI